MFNKSRERSHYYGWQDRHRKRPNEGGRRRLTGNDKLREEGKTDQAVGKAKQDVQKAANTVKKAAKKVIG